MRTFKPSKADLAEFIKTESWRFQMDGSRRLAGWSNYSGGEMEHADWVVVIGRNRDSEVLEESNFASALEQLGGESKNVEIHRFGHWGCGWFELLMVNPKHLKSLRVAYNIHKSLEHYPVLVENLLK